MNLLLSVLVLAAAPSAAPRVKFDTSLPAPAGVYDEWIDYSADPCQDFFQFACGTWAKKNEIPADESRWGQFTLLQHRNLDLLRSTLDQVAQGKAPAGTPYADKLKDFYGTCMDEPALEKNGLSALKAELKSLDSVKDQATLAAAIQRLQVRGWSWPFSFRAGQDAKDATLMIVEADQAGLGLPERDYYFSKDERMQEIRQRYLGYLTTTLTMVGDAQAADHARSVLQLETALAEASMPVVDRRDPQKLYHRLERQGLKTLAPSLAWDPLFTALQIKDVTAVNIVHPPFFEAVEKLSRTTPPEAWRAYLTVAVVRETNLALPKAFRDAHFNFEKVLTGAQKDLPRWRRCVDLTDAELGEALAVPFVEKTFGAEGKADTQAMVKAIEAAFEENLKTLTWMDETTRVRAREKMHQVANKIGYPDKWRSYDGLKTTRDSFLANVLAGDAFTHAYRMSLIGKPLDRQRWMMTPPTVNAYYNPQMNEIVFPAGILQPPFYDRAASPPVNYGAIGLVVGHELTHGFDDEGRQFDAKGNLTQWWTDKSDAAFKDRASCVVKQYGNEIAVDDLKVNGQLTLGENVADMGGLKLAYRAMQTRAGGSGPAAKARFTPEQQFFIGYAHAWCSKDRPEATRMRTATNPHSPPVLRVNVPMRNFAPFAQAFSCREGDRMVSPAGNRCEVW
ncbi:MAG TPA: M13 family metallopeptidase [Myxococcaceae bacterium]|jgi:endothelin-converting enzyme/putative endopeptidase